jgi:predicted Mrr-cat superfamily restriction endonuclease
MEGRVWGMKLGSGGRCIRFCEKHKIVGVGWKDVSSSMVSRGSRDKLWQHLREVYKDTPDKWISTSTGSLNKLGQQCKEGDYVLYYDPEKKAVQICRVTSSCLYREFDVEAKDTIGEEVDIWHYRRVEYPIEPIPIVDFYGALKGRVMGPRIAFWELADTFHIVDQIAKGKSPNLTSAADPEIKAALESLTRLMVHRLAALNESDWEHLVADYLKAQGAHVDERKIGGIQPVVDIEARFNHGELGENIWRVQVKRLEGQKIDWNTIEHDFRLAGDAEFCFVSVFGFTDEARRRADDEGILLLEAGDFTRFLLTDKLRDSVSRKLLLPFHDKTHSAAN